MSTTIEQEHETIDIFQTGDSAEPDREIDKELETFRKDREFYETWQKKLTALQHQIDAARSECKHWGGVRKDYESELRDLLFKGPETMAGRPLLGEIERKEPESEPQPSPQNDPELWRQTPIAELAITAKLKETVSEHFKNTGQLVDWLNHLPREKKKGLGKKAVEQLESAVNLIHEPMVQAELANAECRTQNV
jgi:hypothetical protein